MSAFKFSADFLDTKPLSLILELDWQTASPRDTPTSTLLPSLVPPALRPKAELKLCSQHLSIGEHSRKRVSPTVTIL